MRAAAAVTKKDEDIVQNQPFDMAVSVNDSEEVDSEEDED